MRAMVTPSSRRTLRHICNLWFRVERPLQFYTDGERKMSRYSGNNHRTRERWVEGRVESE